MVVAARDVSGPRSRRAGLELGLERVLARLDPRRVAARRRVDGVAELVDPPVSVVREPGKTDEIEDGVTLLRRGRKLDRGPVVGQQHLGGRRLLARDRERASGKEDQRGESRAHRITTKRPCCWSPWTVSTENK